MIRITSISSDESAIVSHIVDGQKRVNELVRSEVGLKLLRRETILVEVQSERAQHHILLGPFEGSHFEERPHRTILVVKGDS